MKKIYSLLTGCLIFTSVSLNAQDTIRLHEDFQGNLNNIILGAPSGSTTDTLWYDFDADQLPDGSGAGRAGEWFLALPFADVDLYLPNGVDTNLVMASNSWFPLPGAQVDNWLITPSVVLGAHDTLFWKSAPFQTPRYLDGYQVLISTTTNDNTPAAFHDTLFTAAEMTSIIGTNDSIFGGYTFGPIGDFVHGFNGTYVENHNDSARLRGILKPFSVALDSFAFQKVFIAFHHNSFDDNLISIDDIIIGSHIPSNIGIKENNISIGLSVFPNPATNNAQLNFTISSETSVIMNIYNITGSLIYSENKGVMEAGRHFGNINTANLSKGFYTIEVQTNSGKNVTKLIVQ